MTPWSDAFNTLEEACHYYGADTPAQLRAEADYWAAREAEEHAEMEAAFGPYVAADASPYDII